MLDYRILPIHIIQWVVNLAFANCILMHIITEGFFYYYKGKVKLPDVSDMLADMKLKEEIMKHRYIQTQRHTIQVDFIDYMDQLAELNGTLPDFSKSLEPGYRQLIAVKRVCI